MTGILNILAGALGVAKDTYFNLVSLLLPGDGTNGAQNNTFLDGSSNNFTITRNGNTTQGTFSPFSQTGWGAYFDGSGDYLTVADNAAMELGSSNFCIEFWINTTSSSQYDCVIGREPSIIGASGHWSILVNNASSTAGDVAFWSYDYNSFSTAMLLTTGASIRDGAWHHVAVIRNGTAWAIYIDGVSRATQTSSTTIGNITAQYWIGSNQAAPTRDIQAYLSNFRYVVGNAVYTGAFTPPTSPLAATQSSGTNINAITGTQTALLTCQANRFIDNSAQSTPNTPTPTGNTAITPFSPFAPTQAYSAAAVGGSGYFDGTGDYLSIASTSAALPTGTQDYSVEAWVYWGTQGASFPQIITNPATDGFQISYDVSGGTLSIGRYGVASVVSYTVAQSALANQWTHILATRSGNTHRLFVNGVLRGNAVNSISFAALTTQTIASAGAGNYFVGYISGIRTVLGSIPTTYQTSSTTNGTAIFDPPTAPPSTTSQGSSAPSLLLNFTNAGVVDATAKNVLETVGTAQISNTTAKFGGTSIYINGSGNRAVVPNVPNAALLDFGSGDVTIECWVYPTTTSTSRAVLAASNTGFTSAGYAFFINSSNFVDFEVPSQSIIANNNAVSPNTWTHIAFTRASGTNRLFVNGNLCTTSSNNLTNVINTGGNELRIGGTAITGNEFPFTGYIDDLRITKGYARYTAAFTPPSAPFPVQ